MRAPRSAEQRETARVGEFEKRGEAHGRFRGRRLTRCRSRRRVEMHDAIGDDELGVADRAAQRAVRDVTSLRADRGRDERRFLMLAGTAQRFDQLDEHGRESAARET